jgi:hypothetical protein
VFPSGLSQVVWAAVPSGGATGAASGKGDLRELINVPVNGKMIYTVTGVISAREGSTLRNTVTATTATGIRDPHDENNRQWRSINVVKTDLEEEQDEQSRGEGEAGPVGLPAVSAARTIRAALPGPRAGSPNPTPNGPTLAATSGDSEQPSGLAVRSSADGGVRRMMLAKAAGTPTRPGDSGLDTVFDHLGVESILSDIGQDVAVAWQASKV